MGLSLQFCKTLLARQPEDLQNSLRSLLPDPWQQIWDETSALTPSEGIEINYLQEIDPSWLLPLFQSLEPSEAPLFFAILSPSQQNSLSSAINITPIKRPLPKIFTKYLSQEILSFLKKTSVLPPPNLLPEHDFNTLITLSHLEIQRLMTFWGLHDLSFEIRHIIVQEDLKKIVAALSSEEKEYLKKLHKQEEPLIFHRFFLSKWNHSAEHLRQLLTERGMTRLFTALIDAAPPLTWHIVHRMDMHLAKQMLRERKPHTHPGAKKLLRLQFEDILSIIQEMRGL